MRNIAKYWGGGEPILLKRADEVHHALAGSPVHQTEIAEGVNRGGEPEQATVALLAALPRSVGQYPQRLSRVPDSP